MSIFDPQQLYSHRQKSTHKGQVIQKKPVEPLGAYSQSMIPGAIHLLKNYGYSIYSPGQSPLIPIKSTQPTHLRYANLTQTSLNYTVNQIWEDILGNVQDIRIMSETYPNPQNSKIFIGITSIIFYFNSPDNGNIQFYTNGNININDTFSNAYTNQLPTSLIYNPGNSSIIYKSFDRAMGDGGSTGYSGETTMIFRSSDDYIPGVLNYVSLNNVWQEINSESRLANDIILFRFTRNDSTTLLTQIGINVTVSVVLNET